jgi:uncharacterized protein (TIGR03435 family)
MIFRTALAALLACAMIAHSQARDTHPSFDAASLRPANLGRGDSRVRIGGPGTATPGRFSDSNISLQNLLMLAYGVTRSQVAGPQWIESSKYAISVTMPRDTAVEQFRLMLQGLLAGRFALELHHQTRDVPVFTLEPAPGGTKTKKWLPTDARPDFPIVNRPIGATMPGGLTSDEKGFPILPTQYTFGYLWTNTPQWLVRAACRGCAMAEFIENLEKPFLARMWFSGSIADSDPTPLIVDKTGITGKLNFNLEFGQLVALPIIKDPSGGQPFADAIEKQLGIRLVKGKKAPMDVLVVDHAQKTPTEN